MYPGTLDELVTAGYLRKISEDPFTMSPSIWQTIASEPDPTNPNAPAWCVRRQERLRRHGSRRHEILRLVVTAHH
jgi:hypothetical protein